MLLSTSGRRTLTRCKREGLVVDTLCFDCLMTTAKDYLYG
jgi:hypothetical protein